MKRTIIEVFLALALIGAGAFGWLNWQQNQKSSSQLKVLQTAADEAAKSLQASGESVKAAEEKAVALQQQLTPMEAQLQELAAVLACSDRRYLPARYQDADRAKLMEEFARLKARAGRR